MKNKPIEAQGFSEEEIARRRDDVIRRMANTPPKPHSEMKLGKDKTKPGRKPASESKTRPASKGRVHKGKTRT
jgi:hypothetical protein